MASHQTAVPAPGAASTAQPARRTAAHRAARCRVVSGRRRASRLRAGCLRPEGRLVMDVHVLAQVRGQPARPPAGRSCPALGCCQSAHSLRRARPHRPARQYHQRLPTGPHPSPRWRPHQVAPSCTRAGGAPHPDPLPNPPTSSSSTPRPRPPARPPRRQAHLPLDDLSPGMDFKHVPEPYLAEITNYLRQRAGQVSAPSPSEGRLRRGAPPLPPRASAWLQLLQHLQQWRRPRVPRPHADSRPRGVRAADCAV
jgi:hypothetical protein